MADTEKPSPTSLKLRVMKVRELLPRNARELIRKKFPDLDTAKGASLIHNVLMGGSSDERITCFLETLAESSAAAVAA